MAQKYRKPKEVTNDYKKGKITWKQAVDQLSKMTGQNKMTAIPAWKRQIWMRHINDALKELEAVPEDQRN